MIDDRTAVFNLPLPNKDNSLLEDAPRLRSSLNSIDTLLSNRETTANKGAANGYCPLGADQKVPAINLPSFVDDVLEFANLAAFPATGETGKIYVALDTNKTYRWSGSVYVLINPAPGSTDAITEGTTNLYFTADRARAAQQPATASALGVIKVGTTLSVAGDGTLDVAGGGGGNQTFTDTYITPASNGQTVFTISGGYVVGRIELFLNGTLLYGGGDDYTASNGTTITLTIGANTVDTLLLRKWSLFSVVNAVDKSGDTMTGALNEAAAVTIASAATTDIGSATSNNVTVTGTTTITSLGVVTAGAVRRVTFTGALTITHNGTSLILPNATNLLVTAGSVYEFLSLGAGNWRLISNAAPATVLGTLLTGLSTASSVAAAATDSILVAIGKLQAQFNTYADTFRSWTKAQRGTYVTLTDAATIAVDLSLANFFRVTLGGNRILGEPTNAAEGQAGQIDSYQDGVGSRTLTLAWCYQTAGGAAIGLSTGKYALDVLPYTVNVAKSSTITVTIATPGVVSWTAHGLTGGQKIQLATTGALPTGLVANTTYWVIPVDANSFRLATSLANAQAGTAIATTGTQSGVHTMRALTITVGAAKAVA